jgi:hypothetical protein
MIVLVMMTVIAFEWRCELQAANRATIASRPPAVASRNGQRYKKPSDGKYVLRMSAVLLSCFCRACDALASRQQSCVSCTLAPFFGVCLRRHVADCDLNYHEKALFLRLGGAFSTKRTTLARRLAQPLSSSFSHFFHQQKTP